jgi:pterin-4a-carbinolamine dehydratase
MKKYIFILLLFFLPLNFSSQEKSEKLEVELKELEISTAPSVILLGIAPSELEIPKSKKAIVLSVINSFKKNEGIPDSYAFEITPFWLFPSGNMNSLKFAGYNKKQKRQNIFNEFKKASFSLGFVRDLSLRSDDEMKNPAFAFSVRSTLIKVWTKKNMNEIVAQDAALEKILDKINEDWLKSDEHKQLFDHCEKYAIANDSCEQVLLKGKENYEKEFSKKYKDTKDVNYYRNLLEAPSLISLDFAGGYSTFFSDNKFSNNHFGKLGFWLTLNTGFDFTKKDKPNVEKRLNFYGIARYLEDGTVLDANQQFLRSRNYDFGGKAEFMYNRFSISYEYIYRINDIDKTFRSSGLIAYKVSDKVYINAAFGKNYGEKDNLISFLGINWGLDSERKSVFVEK